MIHFISGGTRASIFLKISPEFYNREVNRSYIFTFIVDLRCFHHIHTHTHTQKNDNHVR